MFKYPFPHRLRRPENHQSLNGLWQYKILNSNDLSSNRFEVFKSESLRMDGQLEVPYTLESSHNAIGHVLKPDETLLMTLKFDVTLDRLERLFLYFGAVDQRCRIWLNDKEIGYHEDGYLPFEIEVTKVIQAHDNQLLMAITDASNEGDLPWGKQRLRHGNVWYTPQSGIWQSCGLISYPKEYIREFYSTYDQTNHEITFHTDTSGSGPIKYVIKQPTLRGMENEDFLLEDHNILLEATDHTVIIDDPKLWSPKAPWLYPVDIYYEEDVVSSYMGLRTVGQTEVDGILKTTLNGEVFFQSGVLDQGYWQEGMLTATNQELIDDCVMVKDMGFNMVRKHIKIEPYRFYFHTDRLGLVVWQDMVNGGNNYSSKVTPVGGLSQEELKDSNYELYGKSNPQGRELSVIHQEKVIEHLRFFPSIVMWVIFNEGWGQFDSIEMANLARQQDPTRWIDHASGWVDQGGFDFQSIHTYTLPIELKDDGRMLILSEFGGYSHPVKGHHSEKVFGYRQYETQKEYQQAMIDLYETQIIPQKHLLSGVCYTQLSDVEEEINGLITFDRQVIKCDPQILREINKKLID